MLAWADERCLSCVEGAMRRLVMPGWAEMQTPAPFSYHKQNHNCKPLAISWVSAGRKKKVQMTHQLNTLFSTAIRRKLMLLAACLLLGAAQTWAQDCWALYDESTKTLYFDGDTAYEPTVGQTWTTSQGEQITVSAIWEDDEVLNTGDEAPGWYDWHHDDVYLRDNCTKVVFEDLFEYRLPKSLCKWFYNFKKLRNIEGLYNLNTSEVTNMSYMFAGCSGYGYGSSFLNTPNTLNLHGFDTQKVTDMSYMFDGCTNLEYLYLSSFNTANVTNMFNMFNECTNLRKIYVDESLWSTASLPYPGVTQMFYGCSNIKGGNYSSSLYETSYSGSHIYDDYARVDNRESTDTRGYLTAGGPYAIWCEGDKTLFIGFGRPPYTDSDQFNYNNASLHTITNRWIGELNYKIDPSYFSSYPVWTKDNNNTVSNNCTKVVFTSNFAQNAKRMVMHYWFNQFVRLTTVEGFENLELGTSNKTLGIFLNCIELTSITLPATIREIGDYMFSYCGFTAFNIPAGVTTIGSEALAGLESPPAFTVDAGNTHFKAVNGVLFTADDKELVAYPAGKADTEYTIPSTVQTIRRGAFSHSQNLTSVIIPYGISKIPVDAFFYCQKLTSVNIPNGVRVIDGWAFDGCDLSSVIIPSSVTTINYYAFDRNSNIAEVKVYSRVPPTLGNDVIPHFATLYVPKGSKTDYMTSDWNQYCDNIVEFDVETDVTDLDDAFYITPFRAGRDGNVTIDICLKNAQTATAYNFDLLLPEGVTVVENSATLSNRHNSTHSLTFNDKGNNTYSFAVLSGNSTALADNDGAIIRVTLHVAADVAVGKYAIDIAGASYSEPNGTAHILGTSISSIDILEGMPGDVNGNGQVDIGDAVSIVNHLVSKNVETFIPAAADTNHNGQIDIGDAVTIVNYLVGKGTNLTRRSALASDEKEPQ